jgi:4-amino-4-deoxy-L-arabinose transferase-like glycosyltransferase
VKKLLRTVNGPNLPLPRVPSWLALIRSGEGLLIGVRPYLLLCALCLVLYTPGLAAIPPLDRDEARFAQATRQMLETHDFIRIRFQDEARNKKPAGIYWLQAGAVALFSSPRSAAIWPYRLPSALAATAAVLLIFAFGTRLLDSLKGRFIAAVLMACALGVVVEAHLAKTDAALLAAVAAGQGALGLIYTRVRASRPIAYPLPLIFWSAEGVAILLKGPPGPVLALLTMVSLSIADREIRWLKALRPLAGALIMALIMMPWLIAVERATGGQFILDAVSNDLLPKLVGAQEAHGAPPGYYLALTVANFWPGSLFLAAALLWGWRRRHAFAERFLLAWLVSGWVFFELVPTKLPHYVLPLYPALALLAGGALAEGFAERLTGRAGIFHGTIKFIWGIVTIALAAVLVILPDRFGGALSSSVAAGALVMIGLALLLCLRDWRPMHAAGLVAALATVFVLPAAFEVAPGLNSLWLSRSAAGLLARYPPRPGEAVLSVGYSEPSLVFLLGTETRLVTAAPGSGQVAGAGMALVNDCVDAEFQRSLTSYSLTTRPLDHVEGLDYSAGGSKLRLTLYRLEPG